MDKYTTSLENRIEELEKILRMSYSINLQACPANEKRFDLAIGNVNNEGNYTNYIATIIQQQTQATNGEMGWKLFWACGSFRTITMHRSKEEALQYALGQL